MSPSLCKARPHVLPRLPEWGVCWNIRSADLHPPSLVEMWYEWNLHTQDYLVLLEYVNLNPFLSTLVTCTKGFLGFLSRSRAKRMWIEDDCFISVLLFSDCFAYGSSSKMIHWQIFILAHCTPPKTGIHVSLRHNQEDHKYILFYNYTVIVKMHSTVAYN